VNRSRWIALVVVLVVVLAGGWWLRSRGRAEEPKFRTAALETGDVTATVSATGSVEPVLQVQVGSQVSGTLSKLYVDYNSHVRAGQVLGQLETSAFQARLAQAEAAVAKADAALKDAVRQYNRTAELQKGDYVSQADVDAAEVTVEQRRADLKQARASLESAQVDLDHTTIRSPIDGVVISRSIDVGQTVAASLQAPQLFVIANDLKNMRVETKIDEADIGRIRVGLPVQFTVDAFPDVNFSGTVEQVRLQPLTESNVVTYTTVIATRNDDLRLRPGMTANVTVMVETRQDVLKAPNAALRYKPPGAPAGAGGGAMAATLPGAGGGMRGGAQAAVAGGPGAMRDGGAAGGGRRGRGAAGDSSGAGARSGRGAPGDSSGAGPARAGWHTGASGPRMGSVYVLRDGKPVRIAVRTGITDGAFTEIHSDDLQPGDLVVTGAEQPRNGSQQQLPPGMGPGFRGGRGR
jgi:HlyD family secretion protein